MQNKRPGDQSSEMALDDIYYVLFRHKKKIIFCLLVGIGIAGYLLATKPIIYQTEAELLVKYVSDTGGPAMGGGAAIRPASADNVMTSEMDILRSMDISLKVVADIGADKILAKMGGGTNVEQAAQVVNQNFVVDTVGISPVMHLSFQHPDSSVVQPILISIISNYLTRHKEIHDRAAALGEFQASEKDSFTALLKANLDKLRQVRDSMGVISIDDARTSLQDLKTKTTQEKADLGESMDDENELVAELTQKAADDARSVTNKTVAKKPKLSAELVKDYNGLKDRITKLYATEQDRLVQYTEQSALVKETRAQLLDLEGRRKKMEEANPGLIEKAAEDSKAAAGETAVVDLATEKKKLAKMEKRMKFLDAQLATIHTNSTSIDGAEMSIYMLQAEKKNLEDNLAYFSQSLENSKIEAEFNSGKTPNIKQIEQPETPTLKPAKANKQAGMALFGSLAFGIAWAFLIELYLDTTVKRAKEIEGKLGLPLFLSIPDITRRDYRRRLKAIGDNSLLLKDVTSDLPPEAPVNGENGSPAPAAAEGALAKPGTASVAPWDHKHALFPFYEALRNRLLNYFEIKNLHHKPKLVAVTGCNKKSGTTSIAMGLAASLSETGDGNVLLVDMNLEQGGAQQFYKGKPRLDDALKSETRDSALVQDNLYVVSAGNQGDKFSQLLPKRFANLVPQLKASDYDYIIFDMPPINRTGITQRLAGFMDTVLLVVESEKTSRDVVRQATRLLTESKANVSVVLNKTRTYIPGKLHQEF